MMKRQKNPFLKGRRVSTEPEEQAIVKTPPNDAKLRLLLSNYNHDSCFMFKIPACKYLIHSPRNDRDLSLQLDHETFRPDVSPELFKANRVMLQKKLESSPEFQFEPAFQLQNKISSLSPARRRGRILDPTCLPLNSANIKKNKLRDIVRRKSCHCTECGGLSKLEKKIVHLPPEPRKKRPRNRKNRKSNSVIKGRRGSSISSICSKQLETDVVPAPEILESKTRRRNKTYSGPGNVATPLINKMEKLPEDKASRLFPEKRPERTPNRKISDKRSERSHGRPDKLSQTMSSMDFSFRKTPVAQSKKIEIKKFTPLRSRFMPLAAYMEHNNVSINSTKAKPGSLSSRTEYNKNPSAERTKTEASQKNEKTVVSTTISKDVLALKNLLTINTSSKPQQRVVQTERGQNTSPVGISLSKIKIKQNIANLGLSRGISLPKVAKESSISMQKNDFEISQGNWKQKTGERDESKPRKIRINHIKLRNRSQMENSPYKAELQTTRDFKISINTKTQVTNESLVKNLKTTGDNWNIMGNTLRKKKNKKSKGFEELWKNCMESAFQVYQENITKAKQASGSQSSRVHCN